MSEQKYSRQMIDTMEILEKTRTERMKQIIPLLNEEQKIKLLQGFHPDYRSGTKEGLCIGLNKGDSIPRELVNLLEAYSPINPDNFDLNKIDYTTDVLIIGGGGAGATAALWAEKYGADVLLATKLRLGDSNTIKAQGGIQCPDKENDSPMDHFLDVFGGGHFKNNPELVKTLVMNAPKAIAWLEQLGLMFDKEKDGSMITIHGGGTSRKRMHKAGDYTGAEIMRTLRDEILNKQINVLEFSAGTELLTDDNGKCTGAVLQNVETKEYQVVQAKTVILATGGSGRLHIQGFPTSNHIGATADGLVMAYRAGCEFAFMDTIQYHPTGAVFPEQILGELDTEALRIWGSQLVNGKGERFVKESDTRDAVAAAIIEQCKIGNGVQTLSGKMGVWLDTPMIDIIHGPATIQEHLPAMRRMYMDFGIDIAEEPILVYPTQHYQNGGITKTIEGLDIAGELRGGIHGRNRLMGNSLLDIVVWGIITGTNAAQRVERVEYGELTLTHLVEYHQELDVLGIPRDRTSPKFFPDYRRSAVASSYAPARAMADKKAMADKEKFN
jgi:succinate dehydrogenase / fumarate reductase flavoprotein subunit